MKAEFYKVGSIIKCDILNMSLRLAPVSLVEDDGPNTYVFSVLSFSVENPKSTSVVQNPK